MTNEDPLSRFQATSKKRNKDMKQSSAKVAQDAYTEAEAEVATQDAYPPSSPFNSYTPNGISFQVEAPKRKTIVHVQVSSTPDNIPTASEIKKIEKKVRKAVLSDDPIVVIGTVAGVHISTVVCE